MKEPALASIEAAESRPQSPDTHDPEPHRPERKSKLPGGSLPWLIVGVVLALIGVVYLVSQSRTYTSEGARDEAVPGPMQSVGR